jgi:leucyl aminopeptidase (aminopeptidase T)
MLLFEDETTHWRSVAELPEDRLGKVSGSEWAALEAADESVFFVGPADPTMAKRLGKPAPAVTSYNSEWYDRASKTGVRGVRVLTGYTTPARAKMNKVPLSKWKTALEDALLADPAPIARAGEELARLMAQDADVSIRAPGGTDLSIHLAGREPVADVGVSKPNTPFTREHVLTSAPGGWVYASVDEIMTLGTANCNVPTLVNGESVEGLQLRFRQGRFAIEKAAKGEQALRDEIAKHTGDKDRLGILGIGLHPKIPLGIPQERFSAGVVTLGLGGNDDTGGKNASEFYFETRLKNATVTINGVTVVDKGKLKLGGGK